MAKTSKINKVIECSKINPVVAIGLPAELFAGAVVIDAGIEKRKLNLKSTEKGFKAPKWFVDLTKNPARQLIIAGMDEISKEEQEKFHEILKYQKVSGIDLPDNTTIIVLAKGLKGLSETIIRLCLIVE